MPWFLFILGIIFAFSGMQLEAVILISAGVVFGISFTGFNIDAKQLLIRQYDRFLWFYIGSWRPIPPPLYISVVRIKLSTRHISPFPLPMPEPGKSSRSYKLNLVVAGDQRFISLTRGNRLEMLNEGLKIARLLNIKLLDHTTSEKHWIS
jgi:hypothetical protein